MKKRKIMLLAACLSMIAILAVGGTLAYFMDTDVETNVFTIGNVEIDLKEEFTQNSKLMPGLDVQKKVTVANTGSEDAFVRVHIAVPSMLDSGSEDEPQYAAYNNTLHFNMSKDSLAEGQWSWNAASDGENNPGNGGAWNCYQETINGILYNVYVVTYETALASGAETATAAMEKVYLDTKVTNEQVLEIKQVLGDDWKIYVVAEGGQTSTFEDAYTALNTQFGNPGSYTVAWPVE